VKNTDLTVRFLPVAEEDLAGIVTYVAADNPLAAVKLADRFEALFALIGRNPRMGRVPDDARLRGLGYRYVILDNHLVFCVVSSPDVLIHRIIHGAREFSGLL
jgi:plasmid stabilization system protein ParE